MTPEQIEIERKAFEVWFEADAMPAEANWFERDADGDYDFPTTQCSWDGWLARAEQSQWRPIESAPVDKLILLAGAKRAAMVVGMHHSRDGWVIDAGSEWTSMYPPTHWMPLPAPPGDGKGE